MDPHAALQFWAKVLNGTPQYCSPFNTIPILDPNVASDFIFLQELTAILPIPFMVVGILTNLVFILAVYRSAPMRNVVNIYLGNLAVVDILFLAIIAGVNIDRKYNKPAIYHESLCGCYFTSAAESISFYVGMGLITLAIIHHIYTKTFTCKPSAALNLGIWIVAIGFGCLSAIQYGKVWRLCFVWPIYPPEFQSLPNGYDKCAPGPIQDKNYALYLDLVKTSIFIVVLLVNVILYVPTWKKGATEDSNPDLEKEVSRLLIVNSVVLFLCHSISRVLNIFNAIGVFSGAPFVDQETTALLTVVGNSLIYLNSAIRPVIHATCSYTYRGGYLNALTGRTINLEDDAIKYKNEK